MLVLLVDVRPETWIQQGSESVRGTLEAVVFHANAYITGSSSNFLLLRLFGMSQWFNLRYY
jgi:hypothetical protein